MTKPDNVQALSFIQGNAEIQLKRYLFKCFYSRTGVLISYKELMFLIGLYQ